MPPTTAHRYDFGELPLALHDEIVQGLANGAVLATLAWLRSLYPPDRKQDGPRGWLYPPGVEDLGLEYTLAPASGPGCQLIRVGPQLLEAERATCLDLAIYEAARRRHLGWDAWVGIVRGSDDEAAHAYVCHPGAPQYDFDPVLLLTPSPERSQ
jgi:hypothetical protein